MARGGERRFVVPHVDLHLDQRALRHQQFGREVLAIALRAVANGAKFLELQIDDRHLALQFVARLRMTAVHAGGKQLIQRKGRRLDLAFGEVIVTLGQQRQSARRPRSARTRGQRREIQRDVLCRVHQVVTFS